MSSVAKDCSCVRILCHCCVLSTLRIPDCTKYYTWQLVPLLLLLCGRHADSKVNSLALRHAAPLRPTSHYSALKASSVPSHRYLGNCGRRASSCCIWRPGSFTPKSQPPNGFGLIRLFQPCILFNSVVLYLFHILKFQSLKVGHKTIVD